MMALIIRITKLKILLAACVLVCVSFVFALRAEKAPVSSQAQSIGLPIVMYHHVTKSPSKSGKYVVLESELASDLEYLKSHGYETVTVSDVIDYVGGKKELSQKSIMLTFDDGFESVFVLALPLFEKEGMKGVCAPIGSVAQTYFENGDRNVNYAYMDWEQLRLLNESKAFEVQNHTYDMHYMQSSKRKGASALPGESAEAYEEALSRDLLKMQRLLREKSGICAKAIVYPYGVYSKSTQSIVKKLGFECSLLCEERINRIYVGQKDSLFGLGRFNRPSGVSSKDFFEKMNVK